MSQFLQYFFSGITAGSIYAAVAIGFNLIYSTTGIINFAQGEFLMLGAMTAISYARHLPFAVAIVAAVLTIALCGAALEILFFRRLRSPSALQMIIITIGLSIVIQEAALHIWDEKVRSLAPFSGNEISSVKVLGAGIAPQVFWVLGTVGIVVLLLPLFLKGTIVGKAMRACASDPAAARLAGINTANMRTLVFCLSAGIGALAGCVVSPITMTQYDCGAPLAIKGFAAAMLGGLGNHSAALPAGLAIGLAEAFSVYRLPAAYKDAVAFAILLLVLFLRPRGLFGSREVGSQREF